MTKRTKLLSLVVAAVLCFVAGFAIMFSTTKANADVTLPTVTKPTVQGKVFKMENSFRLANANPTSAEWIIFEYTLSADATTTTEHNGMISTLSTDGIYSHDAASSTAHGYLYGNGTTPTSHVIMPLLMQAIDSEETLVKLYVNTQTGVVAVVKDGTTNSWTVHTGASALTGSNRYFVIGRNDGEMSGRITNVVCYDSNGVDLGVSSTMAELLILPTVVEDAVEKDYGAQSGFSIVNKMPTTDRWIYYEWTNPAGNDATWKQVGGSPNYYQSVSTTRGVYVNATAATVPDNTIAYQFNHSTHSTDLFHNDTANPVAVKLAFDTYTGTSYLYDPVEGVWNTFMDIQKSAPSTATTVKGLTGAAALEVAPAGFYAGFQTNNVIVDIDIIGLKCYDGAGNDLGIFQSGASILPPTVNDSNIRTEGISVKSTSNSSVLVRTSAPVTSNWIFFEWTNGTNEYVYEGSKPGGAGFWILASNSTSEMVNPPVNTKTGNTYFMALQDDADSGYTGILKGGRKVRVGISMADSSMPIAWYDDVPSKISASLNKDFAFDTPINNGNYYAGFWMNAVYETDDGFSATGLRCFDENGNNIDITLSLMDYTAKTVTFMNGADKHAEYKTAMPGNSFAQFTDLTTPTGSGNFVGWTATNGGLDFINISDAVPANGATVYARFMSTEKNVADYAGVYKCDAAKKYFEITADGDLISYVPGLASGDVRVFEESGTTVYSLGANVSMSNVANQITIGNDVYVKTNDYKTVKYMFEGVEFASVKVPTGYQTVSNLAPKKTGHTFVGWYVGEAKFNFGSVINADVTLTAKLSVNVAPEASYELYTFNYYNKAEDTLYIINADKTYAKVSAGVKTTGTYGLLVDGANEYLVFDGDLNNAFRVDNVSADIAGKHYIKLFDEYTITFVFGGQLEDKVLKVNAESNYLVDMPEDPTREGYVFKGWAYGDGTAFDGTKIQANTCEVYAIWEPVEGGVEVGGGIGILTIIAIVVAAVVVLGGVAVFVLWKKKILFAGK